MGSLSYLYLSIFREIKQAKEKQRIIRTGRNKFNANPKEVHVDKSLYFVCIAISILACTCETTAVLRNMHVTEIEHALLVSLGEKMSKHCRAFLLMKFCNESLCVSLILKQNVKLHESEADGVTVTYSHPVSVNFLRTLNFAKKYGYFFIAGG